MISAISKNEVLIRLTDERMIAINISEKKEKIKWD
jgi:hypothetical protein